MFSFFRRGKLSAKNESSRIDAENSRDGDKNSKHQKLAAERAGTLSKDVVNLLIPSTEYSHQKTGVTAILHNIMAGKRRKKKNKHKQLARAESYKEISSTSQENGINLYRSHSQLDRKYRDETLSAPTSETDLTYDVVEEKNDVDAIKELVLQKYKNKPKRHVSLVYVSSEPDQAREAERQHAATLLREIAKKINCELSVCENRDNIKCGKLDSSDTNFKSAEEFSSPEQLFRCCNESNSIYEDIEFEKQNYYYVNETDRGTIYNHSVVLTDDTSAGLQAYNSMGASDSKNENDRIGRRDGTKNDMTSLKDELKCELDKLLNTQGDKVGIHELAVDIEKSQTENTKKVCLNEKSIDEELTTIESLGFKKSNLKPPRSDTEGCSDDDRSDCGKKKVTFRKTISFDDGDQQTDDEVDSSFESLESSESEEVDIEEIGEKEEDEEEENNEDNEVPDNDEHLGGVVVARKDEQPTQDIAKLIVTEDLLNVEDIDLKQGKIQGEDYSRKEIYDSDNVSDKNTSEKEENRINSDNSDSGFLETCEEVDSVKMTRHDEIESESEAEKDVTDTENDTETEEEEEDVEVIAEEVIQEKGCRNLKNLVSQEDVLSAEVRKLRELASTRCGEAERACDLLAVYRQQIQARQQEIEQLKTDLAAAYKESELIRQRSRSLEDDLVAARNCCADLAGKLGSFSDEIVQDLRSELETAHKRIVELEARVSALEREKSRLEREKHAQEQKAIETLAAAEANSARWKAAHEAVRSQAAATAERLLADCEWKMRELEKRARDAEKNNTELTKELKVNEHAAELSQLRGLVAEQQRAVQSLPGQIHKLQVREDALKTEVHRLNELLEKSAQVQRDKDERHLQTVSRLEVAHSKQVESVRADLTAQHVATRATLERAHAERTRAALAQLRSEHEREVRNRERKMRENQNRFDALKETLSEKERRFDESLAEARSKADWELMQLRHLLDKADINYATSLEQCNEKHEQECERLNSEWAGRVEEARAAAEAAAGEARALLESTRARMEAERHEQLTKLKERHRKEMDDQWESFVSDKEECLARMKLECRLEGEEEHTRREKYMREEIAELKAQIAGKSTEYDGLANKMAACERTLAVTEQELREALEREKKLRTLHSEDAEKIKQARAASRNEIEHLQRKSACLRKLFDDMRARLTAREKTAAEESRSQQREIQQLKNEVARLTKILVEQNTPKLGARTRADGCDCPHESEQFFHDSASPAAETPPNPPRRKGGTLRTPELMRKRMMEPLKPLNLGELKSVSRDEGPGRRRAKSVDLPAVQVPVRIKQLEEMNK